MKSPHEQLRDYRETLGDQRVVELVELGRLVEAERKEVLGRRLPTRAEPTCGTCRFHPNDERGVLTECRRFPPVLDGGATRFPLTPVVAWCGEYQAR